VPEVVPDSGTSTHDDPPLVYRIRPAAVAAKISCVSAGLIETSQVVAR
jgi:hypothetical protein